MNSTDLRYRNYNNRGLIRHRFVDNPCSMLSDGTLFSFVVKTYQEGSLLMSTDGGFTWNRILNATGSDDIWYGQTPRGHTTGLDVQGPIVHVAPAPDQKGLFLFSGNSTAGGSFLQRFQYVNLWTGIAHNAPDFTLITADAAREGVFTVAPYQHWVGIVSVGSGDSRLYCDRFSPYDGSIMVDTSGQSSFAYRNRYSAVANGATGFVNTVIMSTTGFHSNRFNHLTMSHAAPVTIAAHTDITSVALARDGYDTLCAVWGRATGALHYATSTNNGTSWSVQTITPPAGSQIFYDSITGHAEARVDVIGGNDGGFLFTYVRRTAAGTPRLYIHRLTTTDGVTYTVDAAREATTRPASDAIVGGRFFKPCEDYLLNLAIPGYVRIGYQVGEGNSERMLDTVPVKHCQELLLGAYPVAATTAPTAPNQDFAAAGMTGPETTKFTNAFSTLGVTVHIRRYDPDQASTMNDITAYAAPVQTSKKVIIDPSSYAFPTPEIDATGSEAWIERDVRRIFFPPDTPLLRTFTLNQGGYTKRTVWTVLLVGNEYEISQVVPRFINDQICFYEANAYVIGPSRDPWSRQVLPSET